MNTEKKNKISSFNLKFKMIAVLFHISIFVLSARFTIASNDDVVSKDIDCCNGNGFNVCSKNLIKNLLFCILQTKGRLPRGK